MTLFSLTISGRWRSFHGRFHASTMTLFSLMISSVNRELVFAVDSIRHPWLNFQRWFLVLQWLSFRWRFMDQHWYSVFDDSMRQRWIYFCYRFFASLLNSLTLSTPYVICPHTSVVISRSPVTLFSLMISGPLWRSFHWRFLASTMTLFSLLISFVNRELVCAADSIRQPWLKFQTWFLVLLWLILCLTIPCIKHESIFAIGFMRRSWIRGRCRLHKSAVNHTFVAISRSIVTLFSLTISGR
jgi:hypothetical protein